MTLEVKWPWSMILIDYADEIIAWIKQSFPSDHELQKHDLFPSIKWDHRQIFIVDDDTTGQCILMNFEKMKPWKGTKFKISTMKIFKNSGELAEMIESDHVAECAKYKESNG